MLCHRKKATWRLLLPKSDPFSDSALFRLHVPGLSKKAHLETGVQSPAAECISDGMPRGGVSQAQNSQWGLSQEGLQERTNAAFMKKLTRILAFASPRAAGGLSEQ